MKDLRSEVTAAFQKEQSAHPPVAGMRRSIVEAATARPPRRELRLQWLAVAAVLVISALVIATLAYSRIAVRTQLPAHASPSPVGDYGPPPPGVPLFYLKDPDHAAWYVGFDWSGKPRATLKLSAGADAIMTLSQSADGSYFIFRPGAKGGGGQFYDRLGKPLTGNGGFAGAQWADDNTHQCGMAVDESAGKWILATQVPGQPEQQVAAVAPYNAGEQAAISLLACSFRNNRAILARIANFYPTDLWVVQLSDGKVLAHTAYTDNGTQVGSIVASGDCTLLGVTSSKAFSANGGPSDTTNVVRLSDGARIMKIDPTIAILAFSADDKTVLVTIGPWLTGQPTHLALMDTQSGQILWRYDGSQTLAGWLPNPTGSGFAVMLEKSPAPGAHPIVDVILVGTDGTAINLSGGYQRP